MISKRFHSIQFYHNYRLSKYLDKPTTELSIESLCKYGHFLSEKKLFDMSNFVKDQISIRLAKRINDFQSLPFVTVNSSHLQQVYDLYWKSFNSISDTGLIKTRNDHNHFLEILRSNLRYHLSVIPKLAMGIQQASRTTNNEILNSFAHSILKSRISRRVLAQQLLKLDQQFLKIAKSKNAIYDMMDHHGDIGIVSTRLGLEETILEMHASAKFILSKHYQELPGIEIDGFENIEMTAIKDHLQYILLEVFKNSLEATVLHNINKYKNCLPAVRVTLVDNEYNTTIRISDQGGGISDKVKRNLFNFTKLEITRKFKSFEKIKYMAATPHEQVQGAGLTGDLPMITHSINEDIVLVDDLPVQDKPETLHEIQERILKEFLVGSSSKSTTNVAPIHLGLGLPMSKVYLDYWKSEIKIQSVDGYGSDVYLILNKVK
eukprot:NODE_68_length_23780_cov_0.251003.p4 type:complete len:433 gc:universal NODE_68_length_23780_cov_0.251003:9186-10484(+)